MPKRSSSVVGREFGNGVRAAIESTGLTQRQLAEALGWQEAKLSDMLAGKGGVNESEVRELLAYCRTPLKERERLLDLFRESGNVWLQMPEDGVPDQVRTLIEQEQNANQIDCWSMILVPGLLQIPEYITVVTEAAPVEAENVPPLVAARVARAEILDPDRKFNFYVHEQALWLPVGGEEVWREQLAHLLRMSVRKYISLRIIPRSAGMHAGTSGDFRVMKFPKYPPVVYIESVRCCLFFDDKETVDTYETILTDLAAVALDEEQSRAVINSILEGLQ
ncbi:helix-turn-helix domain-containing protein [Lentzea albidocapillata]|uniref:Helix-turn-helix domain-containing protein n=1 Tax=Lentzea albidocapillata TaxID=40571 RepID=A0A1W2FML1_9PSEU|nr:helix-turn-helix transcriptional regulator [Lentzea albidocapillata]SMD23123.1 Helix-turn-helix domain-containing protein [Lentzea albidocapillata]